MNITIDISQTAFPGTGVARYTQALVESLIRYAPEHTYTFFFSSLRKDPPALLIEQIQSPHRLVHMHIPPTALSFMWNTLHLVPIEWFVGHTDLYLSSDWTQAPTRLAKKMSIVHDLVVYVYPETSTTKTQFNTAFRTLIPNIVATQKRRLHWVQRECDVIVADSYSTEADIKKFLSVSKSQTSVIYPSVTVVKPSDEFIVSTRSKYSLKKPYLLAVGKIEPRKNLKTLIHAFAQTQLYEQYDLVIVGEQGWGNTAHSQLSEEVETSIKFLGYVPDPELYALYSSAHLFVMPSLYEGFGYPLIEAMALKCPVSASHTSSLGELAKGHGLTFDPQNIESISQTLVEGVTHNPKQMAMVQKAYAFAQTFSQESFAQNLSKIFMSLYNN